MNGAVTHRCSGSFAADCTAELEVPAGGTPTARLYAARTAGWRVYTPRLYRQPMMPVYTCPDCVAAGL